MPHTYVSCYYHCVFATKQRAPLLSPEIRERLYSYFGGIAQQYHVGLITSGGIEDHVHLLFSIPATRSISEVMKLFKGSSSRWLHRTFPHLDDFTWQEGYGAFTVSHSLLEKTISYINNQIEHHYKMDYDQEFQILLRKHYLDIT